MTLRRILAIGCAAALTFTLGSMSAAPADATPIETCTYNQAIASPGSCARQIVYVDTLPGADTYSGSLVLPGGIWEAECLHLNAWQTACILGVHICSETITTPTLGTVCYFAAPPVLPNVPNPQPQARPVFTG